MDEVLFVGKLSLDGSVRHVNGTLPMAHLAYELGYPKGLRKLVFVPQADAPEAALADGIEVCRLMWNPEREQRNRTG